MQSAAALQLGRFRYPKSRAFDGTFGRLRTISRMTETANHDAGRDQYRQRRASFLFRSFVGLSDHSAGTSPMDDWSANAKAHNEPRHPLYLCGCEILRQREVCADGGP